MCAVQMTVWGTLTSVYVNWRNASEILNNKVSCLLPRFRGVGQRRKHPGRGSGNIKIKLGFCSGLGEATRRNSDVQVKWASVRGGEDPGASKTQQIHIPLRGCSRGLGATGWVNGLDPAEGRRMANVNGLSVSSSLTCSQQPQSPGPVWSGLHCSPHMANLCR